MCLYHVQTAIGLPHDIRGKKIVLNMYPIWQNDNLQPVPAIDAVTVFRFGSSAPTYKYQKHTCLHGLTIETGFLIETLSLRGWVALTTCYSYYI
jgi:hypothetical protein